jgi:hypothetical protein
LVASVWAAIQYWLVFIAWLGPESSWRTGASSGSLLAKPSGEHWGSLELARVYAFDTCPMMQCSLGHAPQAVRADMASVVGRERVAAPASATRAWLDILRGAWMVLPAAPVPSEVVAMVRESKGGQEKEEELAWLEALAGCLGAAVALARGQHDTGSQVRKARY